MEETLILHLQNFFPEMLINIVDGTAPNNGRVQISVDGNVGSVCSYGWGEKDTDVFCRQLGYTLVDFSVYKKAK